MIPRTLALLVALLCLLAPHARSQERIWIRPESGTPIVALEVRVAAGPAQEPAGAAGLAHLTARVAARPLRAALDSLGARLTVTSYKDAVAFGMTATPEVWEQASRVLLVALFRDPADPTAVERERSAIRAELLARASNPADALVRETDAAVYGVEHPWGRPTVGTAATVSELGTAQVDDFLRTYFIPSRAVVAVTGPVDASAARRHVLSSFPAAPWQAPEAEPQQPTPGPVRTEYNSITTWISAIHPFPPDADAEAIRLLGSLALERLSFGPSRPSVLNARAEVLRNAAGGELRIEMVVPPAEVDFWTEQLRGAVAPYARGPLERGAFELARRRLRGRRLLDLASPENRSAADAEALLHTGRGAEMWDGVDALSPGRLAGAAAALAAPVLVVLGPFQNPGE
jgi:predicted Zn-dependent peptidase